MGKHRLVDRTTTRNRLSVLPLTNVPTPLKSPTRLSITPHRLFEQTLICPQIEILHINTLPEVFRPLSLSPPVLIYLSSRGTYRRKDSGRCLNHQHYH